MREYGTFLKTNSDGVLEFEGMSTVALAEKYGTPLFVTSENTIRHNYRQFRKAFTDVYPEEVIVCVGMKANWGLAVRRVVVQEGGGGDAFGLGELTVSMLAGSDPSKIVINGCNKTEETLITAIDTETLIQFDHIYELEDIDRLTKKLGKKARVSARIRLPLDSIADIVYKDPRYPEGISPTFWERTFKYGMEPESFYEAVKIADKMEMVSFEGAMYHGGLPRRAGFYYEETKELVEVVANAKDQFGWSPKYLNIGGGFVPIRYGADVPPTAEEYAKGIIEAIVPTCEERNMKVPILMMEPGRYCLDSSAIWLTRVGATKSDHNMAMKNWVYVDGHVNEMSDPFDPRSRVHHVVIANDDNRDGEKVKVDICGQTCNAADVVAKAVTMPEMKKGDLLAFLDVGAYNEPFSDQSNVLPRSATVMISGDRAAVVRRRETITDILSRDSIPSWLMS